MAEREKGPDPGPEPDSASEIEYDQTMANGEVSMAAPKPKIMMYFAETDGTMYKIVDTAKIARRPPDYIPSAPPDRQPWNLPGISIKDYFNFGFDDEKWRLYINKQILMKFEKNLIQRHLNTKAQYENGNRGPPRGLCNMPPPFMQPTAPMYFPPPFGGH